MCFSTLLGACSMNRLLAACLRLFIAPLIFVGSGLASLAQAQAIELIDDAGRAVFLSSPAKRVITLTPHITEMVFAAGGGDRIVATVDASDFPPQAKNLPRVGDGLHPQPEQIAKHRPDLVMGWMPMQVDYLEPLNVAVFISAPMSLEDIPDSIESFGTLLGTKAVASAKAQALRQALQQLEKSTLTGARPVRVMIQLGAKPDFSLNDSHILSDVIRLCGGVNVLGDAPSIAPRINTEGVLATKPDLVLIGLDNHARQPDAADAARAFWSKNGLEAAVKGHVYGLDADVIFRPGPRLIEQAADICQLMDRARR